MGSGKAVDAIPAFIDAMRAAGMPPAEPIANALASGQRVRFECEGDRKGRKNGWAILYLDGHPAGAFGHHRLGISQRWTVGGRIGLSKAERIALAAECEQRAVQRDRERLANWQRVASEAKAHWEASDPADPGHPYLIRKGIGPEAVRQSGMALIVPMTDASNAIWNLQRIYPDGGKRFLKDGRTAGMMWRAGPDSGGLCIGEGYATMAAVRAATDMAVCAALSASNLEPVALAMRAAFPGRDIILCADHDGAGDQNLGLEKAAAVARLIDARLASPCGEVLL